MKELTWFAVCVCITAWVAASGAGPVWIAINIALDVFAFIAAVKAMRA